MRVLVDILHPAHVHVFRNAIAELQARGHQVVITAREKDGATTLLDQYGLAHEVLSRQATGAGLALELAQRTRKLLQVVDRTHPDVMIGIMGPSIALAGKARRIPAVVFYDTEFAWQTNWFVYRLAHAVCTPDCYQGRVPGRHVTYPGYHELAYLHPSRFTPDPAQVRAFGVDPDEPYSLVRFVSWQASHDIQEKGLTLDQKRRLVRALGERGRVLISSEKDLPDDLEPLRVRGPYNAIHHLMAHAQLLVGESATMASEAAVLGVPAVYIAKTGRGYTDDQERRYGLVRNFTEERFDEALATVNALLADDPRAFGQAARERLLADKIDVTAWMVDRLETWFGRR